VTQWIKLESPQVALNAPNVKRFAMKYSPVIPWDWNADRILGEGVPKGVRHLVFNCHGYASRPGFGAPHLSLGTVLHPGNVGAFDQLMRMDTLLVIWISACNIAGSADGMGFCKAMAKRSGCYVVTQSLSVPDAAVRAGHIENYSYAMPAYINPAGDLVTPSAFFAKGGELGFGRPNALSPRTAPGAAPAGRARPPARAPRRARRRRGRRPRA
jgi:hypothetical protein